MSTTVPADLGQQAFTEEERAAKERQIRAVEEAFWPYVDRTGFAAPFLPDAVAMVTCMTDPETPFWVKATIASALAYLVDPDDLIPDAIPVAGTSDDAAVIATAMYVVHPHLRDAHWAEARRFLPPVTRPEVG